MNFSNFDNLPVFERQAINRIAQTQARYIPVDLFILKFDINQSLSDNSDALEIT